jgi:exopolyphosphatase / guanosine-5'-triphosphate,3'-diphosphate pyrophosphatase
MRLAAIDIGTNSVHMIVVQVRPDLSFEVIGREKEMVRLGAGGLGGKALTAEAMSAALQALSKFRRLAESLRADEILATATSAVREAENGGEFLAAIEQQTGIRAQLISGTEEARLIHLAAVYGVEAAGSSLVVIDIGGGSVEVTLGTGTTVQLAKSFKLGVIRLTERFVRSDPISAREERKLVKYVRSEIKPFIRQVLDAGYDRVVGTSGTILSLGAVIAAEEHDEPSGDLRNRRISAKHLHRLRRRVVHLGLEDRLALPGLDPKRADLVVAGSVLLDTIIDELGADSFTLCDLALREGLVLDYIKRNRRQIAQVDRYPDIRRRSVIELAERCHYWPEHAHQVTRIALAIFDQTRKAHGYSDREREWLEFASILHDIGVHISYPRHHKHSYYLIMNGDLRGFAPDEVAIIGLVARYHRSAEPKRTHEGYSGLSGKRRRTVRTLAAILRLAESFDRSHSQAVSRVELHDRGDDLLLTVRSNADAELEVWAAARHLAPFQRMIGKPVRISAGGVAYGQQIDDGSRLSGKTVRGRGHRRVGKNDAARPAGKVA